MTGRDAIGAALRLIGVLASGETPSAPEAQDGLSAMNRMLGSWSTEGLMIHAITAESPITLTPGDATVSLGTGGDITTRPISIEKAMIRDGSTDYPVDVRSLDQYAQIQNKSAQSTHPSQIYDDGGYPQRTLTLWPVPSTAASLVLYTKRPLSSITTLDTEFSLPEGYDDAIINNLAVRMAPEYGKSASAELVAAAVGSKGNIKRANHRPQYLKCDAGVLGPGRFNFVTGDYR